MIPRLTFEDWRTICHYLGALVLLMAATMLIPLVVAIALQEYDALVAFLTCIGVTGIVGAIMLFARVKPGYMDWRQALVVSALSWVVLSFLGTIPLWLSGHYASFLDAFFEGVSGLTATGFSLVLDIDHMAYAFITWRFVLHLLGGIGVLVIAMALGLFGSGSSAATIYNAEGRGDHVMPELKQTSRFIGKISAVIILIGSVACFVPMLFAGQSPLHAAFNSVWTTVSAYCTGGMQGSSAGIMFYHSWPLEILTMLIMFFGIINFTLYGDLWRGMIKNFFKDIEVRTLVIWVTALVVVAMFALCMGDSAFTTLSSKVRRVLYLIISAATNTGFATTYPGQVLYVLGNGTLFVVILALIMGGSASSTTGGIKAFRFGIIAKAIAQTIREALAPDAVRPRTFYYHRGRRILDAEIGSSALTIFMLYILTFAIGTIIGIGYGYDALPAIFDAVSAGANAGLSVGVVSSGMPAGLEAFYILEMLLGRLEFIALFAMLIQVLRSFIPDKLLSMDFKGRR